MNIYTLNIDLETRSGADISKTGVYRYAEDESFDILLFGVSVNQGPVKVYDLANGEQIPEEILAALTDRNVIKYAYNASFERVCLSYWLKKHHPKYLTKENNGTRISIPYIPPAGWRCSMVLGFYNGLPGGLEKIGAVLGLEQQKLKEGKDLIRYFCTPVRQRKSATENETKSTVPLFHLPADAPQKWEMFKTYNKRDVEVELQILERLQKYPVPDDVWEQYEQDQEINDRGIRIDQALVKSALGIDAITKADLTRKMTEKTGMDNPNSVIQLKAYLNSNGLEAETIGKKEIKEMLETVPENIREVLSLRLQLAKSSVKKYEAMQNAVCRDGRCRGMFQFYGAVRSGRWAGRLIQLQNLPQNHMKDLDAARELVKQQDYETLNMLYDNIPQALSELIRTAFIPEEGNKFIVADFSAIEARVLSYLAGETWRSEVFKNGGDIYCASAEKMFKVPVEKDGQNKELRQKGKIAELALGYGGAAGALRSMDTDKKLKENELQPIVNAWREANPHIVRFWWTVDEAVKNAIQKREQQVISISTATGRTADTPKITFTCTNGMLFITLPSGRRLSYVKPRIEPNQYGGESITYMGNDFAKKWTRIESYGPKFVENIVQAISRDILAEAMENLKNYRIVGHVHDEVIIEAPETTPVQEICAEMQKTPGWLPKICLRADGYECGYYMKS